MLSSCNSSRKINSSKNVVEIKTPFNSSKYRTDKQHFRAVGIGKSDDLSTAREMAMVNARSQIVQQVKTLTKNVTEAYRVQDNEHSDVLFNKLTRDISAEILTNIKEIDNRVFQDIKTNKYQYWVALEVKKDDIVNYIVNNNKNIIKNKEEFTKIYDDEMDEYVTNKQ
jgi:hypothetical protein